MDASWGIPWVRMLARIVSMSSSVASGSDIRVRDRVQESRELKIGEPLPSKDC